MELFAWAEGVNGFDAVAHLFYRKFIGLQSGTSGVIMELILGRESIKLKAIRRALIFWRRSNEKDEGKRGLKRTG